MTASRFEHRLLSPVTLIFALALSFFFQISAFPLFDLDEGAFSEATREMLASGNFLATYLDGEPRYDKPILSYWLQAASIALFGPNEWAFRLPSALAASLWVIAVFFAVRQQADQATGMIAALLACNAVGVTIIGKAATADALLNLWLALAFLDMQRYFNQPAAGTVRRVFLWLGLGMLTKGPVAVAIPLLAGALFIILTPAYRPAWWAALRDPLAWIIFIVVVVPWYALVALEQGSGFYSGFFLEHNLGRFTSTREGHGGNVFYYLLFLPLILLPFSGWLIAVLLKLRRQFATGLERFAWLWVTVVFILFSFSQTQLPHYILYGCTPLFMLLAIHRTGLKPLGIGTWFIIASTAGIAATFNHNCFATASRL